MVVYESNHADNFKLDYMIAASLVQEFRDVMDNLARSKKDRARTITLSDTEGNSVIAIDPNRVQSVYIAEAVGKE